MADDIETSVIEDGSAPPSSFYGQVYPRAPIWRETLNLLRNSGVPDDNDEVVAFVNNAVQLTIRRGGHLAELNDIAALGVALDARAKEMNVILLDLAIVMNDIVYLTEFSAVLGPFQEDIKRDLAR
jgi:hypothetical protein